MVVIASGCFQQGRDSDAHVGDAGRQVIRWSGWFGAAMLDHARPVLDRSASKLVIDSQLLRAETSKMTEAKRSSNEYRPRRVGAPRSVNAQYHSREGGSTFSDSGRWGSGKKHDMG